MRRSTSDILTASLVAAGAVIPEPDPVWGPWAAVHTDITNNFPASVPVRREFGNAWLVLCPRWACELVSQTRASELPFLRQELEWALAQFGVELVATVVALGGYPALEALAAPLYATAT